MPSLLHLVRLLTLVPLVCAALLHLLLPLVHIILLCLLIAKAAHGWTLTIIARLLLVHLGGHLGGVHLRRRLNRWTLLHLPCHILLLHHAPGLRWWRSLRLRVHGTRRTRRRHKSAEVIRLGGTVCLRRTHRLAATHVEGTRKSLLRVAKLVAGAARRPCAHKMVEALE